MKPDDLLLWEPKHFDARFLKYTRECDTLHEAWEQTERDFRKVFGRSKYKNYESYRLSRRRRIV